MRKFIYLIKRIRSMNFLNFWNTILIIHKETNKSIIFIFIDIVYCGLKYMAGYVDYEVFGFYNLTKSQRKTIITRGINNKFVKFLNNPNYAYILDDKIYFNKIYNSFLNREWLDLRTTSLINFKKYLKSKKQIIAKPINLSCGKGVEKIIYSNSLDLDNIYLSLKENKQYLLEDYIVQHSNLNNLYPEAVNTLRLVTVLNNNVVNILFSCIRIGNNGHIVDNFNSEGLLARIDNDGIIRKPAIDKAGNIYNFHPYTKTPIINFKIPLFEEAINLVKDLAFITPQIRYTAWDIAITSKGPVVVEGNPFPGHDIYYSKAYVNENGLLPRFKNIIKK